MTIAHRPEIDVILNETMSKIGAIADDSLAWCKDKYPVIYAKLVDWGKFDNAYMDMTEGQARDICLEKVNQFKYVINLRKKVGGTNGR